MKIFLGMPFGHGYANWLIKLNENSCITENIEEADLVLLTGGSDINPKIYDEKVSKHTYYSEERDKKEISIFNSAVKLDIPVLGICRGLQLLCGLCGGKVIQDVSNHAGHDHSVIFSDGEEHITSSLHHQMVYPFNLPKENYELIAWSTERLSKRYLNGDDESYTVPPIVEPEVVKFFKDKEGREVRCIGIQGHPEMMEVGEFHKKLNNIINLFIK